MATIMKTARRCYRIWQKRRAAFSFRLNQERLLLFHNRQPSLTAVIRRALVALNPRSLVPLSRDRLPTASIRPSMPRRGARRIASLRKRVAP